MLYAAADGAGNARSQGASQNAADPLQILGLCRLIGCYGVSLPGLFVQPMLMSPEESTLLRMEE